MPSLREVADRYAARAQLTAGSEVDDLTELVLNERPDVKRGSARAAARAALGVSEPAPAPAAPVRKARRRKVPAGSARKVAKRAGVTSLGLSGSASVGGIVAQTLGLIVLYFVLTNAATAAGVLASVRQAVEWVLQPVPLRR